MRRVQWRNCGWVAAYLLMAPVAAQTPEKQLVLTITSDQLQSGVVSEVTWDAGTLVIQGVFANAQGKLTPQYFAKPADSITLLRWPDHSTASRKFWETKSRRISPTGIGRIELGSDSRMPMYGIDSLQHRVMDAATMGGMITTHTLKLNGVTIHERENPIPPYDGEVWSWSPLELNRIAYVDGKGDLWVAGADGRRPRRIARGDFTLPAWSDDGRLIAIAERKTDRWEVSVISVPADLRRQ